eukprot:CAMPEP_0185020140 /NCGR_PEP_ID=MMETSP1103-20130426/2741_1 /TAXON_ID=36769 /ORGANISM="Paraphysomonas bandaiensis, Strain Caron Lab Isolate" /LENGTH=528 /DNA_ID=CAMNT_0027550861 /DNA_START=373 /DNA_END=1959 /DNA_ORIENTATION=-
MGTPSDIAQDESCTERESESSCGPISSVQEGSTPADNKYDDVSEATIFVGDLSREASERDVREIFTRFGDVLDVVVKRSKSTLQPLGYGFVTMKTVEMAQQCVASCENVTIKGRKIRVGKAQRNCRLYISNLDTSVTTEDLNSTFNIYGELCEQDTEVECCDGRSTGSVRFVHRRDAEDAKEALDGHVLYGSPMHVEWYRTGAGIGNGGGYGGNGYEGVHEYRPYPESGLEYIGRQPWGQDPVISVHVRFSTMQNAVVDEKVLYQTYRQYGHVTSVSIKANIFSPETGQRRGYAFVHYEVSQRGRIAAYLAVNALADATYRGVRYVSQLSRNFLRVEEQCFSSPPSFPYSLPRSSAPVSVPYQYPVHLQDPFLHQHQQQMILAQQGLVSYVPMGVGIGYQSYCQDPGSHQQAYDVGYYSSAEQPDGIITATPSTSGYGSSSPVHGPQHSGMDTVYCYPYNGGGEEGGYYCTGMRTDSCTPPVYGYLTGNGGYCSQPAYMYPVPMQQTGQQQPQHTSYACVTAKTSTPE